MNPIEHDYDDYAWELDPYGPSSAPKEGELLENGGGLRDFTYFGFPWTDPDRLSQIDGYEGLMRAQNTGGSVDASLRPPEQIIGTSGGTKTISDLSMRLGIHLNRQADDSNCKPIASGSGNVQGLGQKPQRDGDDLDDASMGSVESSGDEGEMRSMRYGDDVLKAKAKNREHARNTRKRKKTYIETMRQTVVDLAEERERLDRNRRITLSRVAEYDRVRKQVLQCFLFYRSSEETDKVKWSRIMEKDFTMVLPITPYRSFPGYEVSNGKRYVEGVDGVVRDTKSLHVMMRGLAGPDSFDSRGAKIAFNYCQSPDDVIMSGDTYMCRWVMKTVNAVACGAKHECFKTGMLRAIFSEQNKLTKLEMCFDVMSFMQQIRRSLGTECFNIIPNSVEIAESEMQTVKQARIITSASPPFGLTSVNRAWEDLCGYSGEEVAGKHCGFLQGPKTDPEAIAALMENVRMKRPGSASLINYKKCGGEFKNLLCVYPLFRGTEVTHFLGTLQEQKQED